ncbi:MAG: PAS domain S-box protein [Methylobacter sp.]|nr:PAS domain S-box protein [Methylobacter sp.]
MTGLSISTGLTSETLISVLVTIAIGGGAALQAIVGAYLVKRFADFPNSLASEKEVFLFLFFGGVVSALVNSTFAVSTLMVADRIPATNFPVNWGTWWLGDALGVFIFTPMVLVWAFCPREPWQNRRMAISLPIIAMFALTTAAVFYESKNESERLMLAFNKQALELKVALESSVSNHMNALYSIESFYSASKAVDREEFRTFVAQLLGKLPGIQALGWNPLILGSERHAFELSVRSEGYPGFQISEQDADEQIVIAESRPAYVPVSYIEPYKGNEIALGYDVYSDPVRREAIDRARDSGELATTTQVILIQERRNQHGILTFMPIYRNGFPHKTREDRRRNISGYLVAVFQGGDIVTEALNGLDREGLSYRLIDESAPFGKRLIFSSDNQELKAPALQETGLFGRNLTLMSEIVIPVGGRQWHFVVTPTQAYLAAHRSNHAWLILLAGLMLTSIVGVFAMVSSGRGSILRRLVEERTSALAQSEERLRSTFEAAPIGVANVSVDGRFLEVNQGFCDIIGYSRDELLAMTYKQLTQPDYHLSEVDKIKQVLAGKMPGFSLEKQYVRKDGGLVWANLSVKLIRHPDGAPDHFVAVVDNIDRRKQAEESLRKLSLAVEQSPSSVVITDLDGNIEYANDTFFKTTGYSRNEVIGQNPRLLQSGKTSKETYDDMWASLSRGDVWKGELTNKKKNGVEYVESALISPVRQPDGEITHYVGIKEDITERKQGERFLQQAKEDAEALAQSKSDFLANMSHEIRTPMNAILGLSHLALNKKLSPEIRDYLEKISSSSTSLLNILNDVLDFSKLEAGRLTIDYGPFDLDAMLDNLSNLFADYAKEKSLGFDIVAAPDVPRDLIGDTLRLQQVLINLLGNAIKFTENGKVMLNITVRQMEQSQVRVLFCVTDTGIGMSDYDRDKLFQPFSQVDGSITRRFGGTGLGLVISHNLLQLMDSEFLVESTPGQGSSFGFELTLGVSSVATSNTVGALISTPKEMSKALVGRRVLVAEDNRINQQVVKEFLNLLGIAVEIANNGKEALTLLENSAFDAVLMDIHMPDMDGFEATKLIRSQACFAKLPVIALTAGVTKQERDNCMASGMNDFVAKPINPNQLMATLAQWIMPIEAVATETAAAQPMGANLLGAEDMPVFDLHNLLMLIGNNQELAAQLLLTFMDNMKGLPGEIEAEMTAENFVSARELVHKVKGASGNIGAVRLYVASSELETELKNGRVAADAFNIFREAFEQAMSIIAEQYQQEQPLPSGGRNIEELTRIAAELDLLLKENDFISEPLLNTFQTHLALDQHDLFIRLRKRINNLQYREARKILRQLAELSDTP